MLKIIYKQLCNLPPTAFVTDPDTEISKETISLSDNVIERLLNQEPPEYVFNNAEFLNITLQTDSCVLIPRPETEELVNRIFANLKKNCKSRVAILDIGTGSGCIPVWLAVNFTNADYYACDISEKAIETAQKNAELNNVKINFFRADILNNTGFDDEQKFDVIVSNPPYVLQSEKKFMSKNVLDYEPHTALFVPDNNPLIFYKAICDFATKHLNRAGKLYFEINERFPSEMKSLLEDSGFKNIKVEKDLFGKYRIAEAEYL